MDWRGLFDLTFPVAFATTACVEAEVCLASGGGPSIEAHIQAALAGDPDGYRQLFRLHAAKMHRLVRRLIPGPDIEDAIQVIFVEAFRSLPSFRRESSFSTWLSRIAIRVAMRRAKQSPPPFASIDDASTAVACARSGEADLEARRALRSFQRILAELSEKRRTAFVLHVLEGYSLEEVAAIVDANVGAVKVRVHDARIEIERHARRDPSLSRYLAWTELP